MTLPSGWHVKRGCSNSYYLLALIIAAVAIVMRAGPYDEPPVPPEPYPVDEAELEWEE